MHSTRALRFVGSVAIVACFSLGTFAASAAPPVPSSPHPRLFMSAAQIAAYGANAGKKGTSAASLVKNCQDSIDTPADFTTRGGADGDTWPGTAMSCAFAYRVTQKAQFLTQALKYWHAALEDDQNLGDKKGCVAGVATDWTTWDGNPPAPPVILTVTHDTGYPMRWYGPDMALTYDWLNGVAGVDAALLDQTRTCISAWSDYYTAKGYHAEEAGANYNAGFIIGKTLTAIAIGNDGGADGHLWTQIIDDQFTKLLIGQGLAGASGAVGSAAGPMVGGDWAEGWQYGPLSVLEYAVAARAIEENGAPLPAMDAWANSLAVRYIYGTNPAGDGQWAGEGDFDSDQVYQDPTQNEVDAVLAGPSGDQAAGWAAFMKQKQSLSGGGYFYNALAELRTVTASDFTTQSPAPSLWYLSHGTRAVYARTAWDANAFWTVFAGAPQLVSDHEHFAAGNFVFSRGADALIVDTGNYGEPDTFESNAISVDSNGLKGDYAQTQTPWSQAELLWARGTSDAVYAARSDFAKAFIFSDTASDIPYAHREWVMTPEGEIVTIDRVHTADATHAMYLGFHVNSGGGGKLTLAGSTASATIGGSKVAIHAIALSGGTPAITQPEVGSCTQSCSYPCGKCDAARYAVDKYSVKVPGPHALAIHAIDGLASADAPAIVGSINDDTYDPAPKQNAGVIGAAVFRSTKQTFVVASSAADGAAGTTMTYGVPGTSASRHIVFDAPEDSNGKSTVTAAVQNGRCVLTITAGAGFAGHPLMFGVSSAADGCVATESTDVAAGQPPVGGGEDAGPLGDGGVTTNPDGGTTGGGDGSIEGGGGSNGSSGCGCVLADEERADGKVALGLAIALGALFLKRRAGG